MTIATVRSDSNPAVQYDIRQGKDGVLWCTCPSWKYQRLPPAQRTCKHLRKVAAAFQQKAA